MELSVIIPVLNEEENIFPLYKRLRTVIDKITEEYEFVFVNDGSADETLARIKDLSAADERVRFLDFSRNFGHQIAVTAGLDFCSGASVVIIDADLQDPPELIPEMYAKLKEGYEVVYARRVQRKGETFFKRMTASLFYRLLNFWSNIDIPLDVGDFRIIDAAVVNVLRQMPERNKFLRGQISWIGFRQTFIQYVRDERFAGKTKYPLRKMLRFALDGLTGFSTTPLKIATIMGFLASFMAFLLMVWVLVVRMFGETLGQDVQPGWASQMIAILFLGGVQLIGIGVLGEYIGRINDDVKKRPLYILRQKSNKLNSGAKT